MRVRMLRTCTRVDVDEELVAGQEYDLPQAAAEGLIRIKFAERVKRRRKQEQEQEND